MALYLYRLHFIKATKAAGQSRLSKFEAVECSKIGHSWAASTNPIGIVSTDPLWPGEVMKTWMCLPS